MSRNTAKFYLLAQSKCTVERQGVWHRPSSAGCDLPATIRWHPKLGHLLAAGPAGGTWLDLELIITSIEVFLLWCLRAQDSGLAKGPAGPSPALAHTVRSPPVLQASGRQVRLGWGSEVPHAVPI